MENKDFELYYDVRDLVVKIAQELSGVNEWSYREDYCDKLDQAQELVGILFSRIIEINGKGYTLEKMYEESWKINTRYI